MNHKDWQSAYLSFYDQLKSYLYRLTAHHQEAEDLAQNTYEKVSKKIDTFEGRSSFKTWVFTIATNLARDNYRVKKRWGTDWMDLVKEAHMEDTSLFDYKKAIVQNDPHTQFVIEEHINYCFTCTSKTLLLKEQLCLWLKEVYQFKVSEIMTITELSEGKVKHALANARKIMKHIFNNKCALVNKEGVCHQCTGLNGLYNAKQEEYLEFNQHKKAAERKENESLFQLRLQIVSQNNPLNGEGFKLHNYLLESSPELAKQQSLKKEK